METKSGRVINVLTEVISKPGKRPFTVHRVLLSTGDEVEVGFKQPYKIGDNFNSEVEFKYGKYKEVKPLAAGSSAGPSVSSASSGSGSASAAMNFPIPKTNKETAIIRQNALTNAVNMHVGMIKAGIFTPDDEFADHVISLAYKFAEFSSGQREIRLAKDLVDGND